MTTNSTTLKARTVAHIFDSLEKLAERMIDFAEAGIARFGSPEAFVAALTAYNNSRA